QLTMRTFHLGGIAAAGLAPELDADHDGILIYMDLRTVQNEEGTWFALNKNGSLHIVRDEGRSIEEYKKLLNTKSIEPLQTFLIELGTRIILADGSYVKKGERVGHWEPHNIPIICERPGYVKYEDLVEGISTQKEVNKQTGMAELIVKQHRGELHPQIIIYSDPDYTELVGTYAIPSGAFISVQEGQRVSAGMLLARLPRGAIKTKDITGGLPRVAELFEARRPKEAAEIAKIDGIVDFRGVQKSKRIVVVQDPDTGMEEEHLIPLTKHLIVQKGDLVVKGQQLTDGLVVPHEILDICGIRELQRYLVNQVQEVYRLQGVDINDKHIEVIVRQMLQKVRVTETGDTTFLYGEDVDKKSFHKQNQKVIDEGGRPALATPVLLGITKTALITESPIAAASFQETTRVLTEAGADGKVDLLLDHKSNIIMGQAIPSGTGFEKYEKRIKKFGAKELLEELTSFSFAD
ncbi:MAG TPA: DNA-directed RNA polymerase subunit beta', partial [Parachlamydiales bacterium]|nr:DNA-directed RNA polymerase subunit beta' [Parachlamydiales bacterium]